MPALTPTPPISKETIKKVVGQVLDVTVPGSELIKILSGLSDSPQSQEGWLKLALDTALDFMPGGKILKFLKGNAARLGIKQIENQLLKIAAKKAGKAISKSLEKISDNLLKKRGIDAHKLKQGWLGKNIQISKFDLYKDKVTGEILILLKGGKGVPIHTGEFIK